MTATIIPFPRPVPGGLRLPASTDAVPLLPSSLPVFGAGPGTASGPTWPTDAVRHGLQPSPGEPGAAGPSPARGTPYLGPCRRLRGLRSQVTGGAIAAAARTTPKATARAAEPDRLTRALEGLRTALTQQAAALAGWRDSLVELEGAVGSLQSGMARQGRVLRELGTRMPGPGTAAGGAVHPQPS